MAVSMMGWNTNEIILGQGLSSPRPPKDVRRIHKRDAQTPRNASVLRIVRLAGHRRDLENERSYNARVYAWVWTCLICACARAHVGRLVPAIVTSERVPLRGSGWASPAHNKHGSESPWSGFLKISASLSLRGRRAKRGPDTRRSGGARSRRRVATGRTYNSRRDVCTPTRRRALHSGRMTHTVQRLRAIPFPYPWIFLDPEIQLFIVPRCVLFLPPRPFGL